MENPDRRTLAFACAVLQGQCTPGYAMATLARSGETDGPPSRLLGTLWEAMEAPARERLTAAFQAADGDPGAARALVRESGIEREPVPGSLPAFAATVRPASSVRLPPAMPRLADASRFEIRQEHARGGMGRILIAWDARLGREVALKELLPGIGATVAADGGPGKSSLEASDRERFFREARVTGQLEHPNIVPVYEMGERDGAPFYAMRLIRGDTLASRLERIAKEGGAPEDRLQARLRLLDAMLDVCDAVAYAHSRGVVNRDLKPANIMLGDFGETFVLDWGLARVQGHEDRALPELNRAAASLRRAVDGAGSPDLTLAGSILGTPAYMPPEQARGELDRVDERSDVYALGAILYEILTGRPPFEGQNLVAVLQAVIRGEAFPATRAEPLAPRDLAAIAHCALERDPARRYPSVRQFGEDLRACRDGRPVTVYRYGAAEQLSRFARRNRALALSLTAAMLLLVAGTAVALHLARVASSESVLARTAEREARAAEAETAKRAAGEKEALEATRLALHRAEGLRLAATSLTMLQESPGIALALALEGAERAPGASSNNALVSALLELRERRVLQGHGFFVTHVAWSPSGTRVATASLDHSAILWEAESGRLLARLEGHRGRVQHVEFSPDGSQLLTAGEDGTARVWNVETAAEVQRLGNPKPGSAGASWHPRGVAVLSWGEGASIWRIPGGQEVPLAGASAAVIRGAWSPDGARVAVLMEDGRAGFWDGESGSALGAVSGPPGIVALEFNPDGLTAVAAWKSGRVAVLDAGTGEPRAVYETQRPLVDAVFCGNGERVAALDSVGGLRFLSAATGESAGASLSGAFELRGGLSRDGKTVLRIGDSRVDVLDTESGALLARYAGHESDVNHAAFDREGRRLATASSDLTARIWDCTNGSPIPRVPLEEGEGILAVDGARGAAMIRDRNGEAWWVGAEGRERAGAGFGNCRGLSQTSPGHSLVIRADGDGSELVLADTRTGERFPAPGPLRGAAAVGISADGPVIACRFPVGSGKTETSEILTVDGRTWEVIGRYQSPVGWRMVVPSGDGTRALILNPSHAEIEVIDLKRGQLARVLSGHTGTIISAVFLPGDQAALSFASDATVRRWNLETGAMEAKHDLPRITGGSLVRSLDGRLVALVTPDFVRVLDPADLREVFTLPVLHAWTCAFAPDGSVLYVPDGRGSLLCIPVDLASFARSVAPRAIRARELNRYEIGEPEWRKRTVEELDRVNLIGLRATIRSNLALKAGNLEEALTWAKRGAETCPSFPDCWYAYLNAMARQPEEKRDMAELLRAMREYLRRGFQTPEEMFKAPELAKFQELPEVQNLLKTLR